MGVVVAIHLAERASAPVFAVETVRAVAGRGLEGDRIINDADDDAPIEPHRHVTFIECEALEHLKRDYDIDLDPAASRRNVATRGIALNHLLDQEFTVGDVRLRGVELCEPCGTLERLCGQKGVVKGLIHRGGLRAEIIGGGSISVGDTIG